MSRVTTLLREALLGKSHARMIAGARVRAGKGNRSQVRTAAGDPEFPRARQAGDLVPEVIDQMIIVGDSGYSRLFGRAIYPLRLASSRQMRGAWYVQSVGESLQGRLFAYLA